jgi:hypothetical protein
MWLDNVSEGGGPLSRLVDEEEQALMAGLS